MGDELKGSDDESHDDDSDDESDDESVFTHTPESLFEEVGGKEIWLTLIDNVAGKLLKPSFVIPRPVRHIMEEHLASMATADDSQSDEEEDFGFNREHPEHRRSRLIRRFLE